MKKPFSLFRISIGFALLITSFGVSGCSGGSNDAVSSKPVAPEQALAERAKLYWDYKVSGELEKAYLLEDPRVREKLKLRDYLMNVGAGVKWLAAEVGAVDLQQDPARVSVALRFSTLVGGYSPQEGRSRTILDKWVRVDNEWYHYLKPARERARRKSNPITVRKDPLPSKESASGADPSPSSPAPESNQAPLTAEPAQAPGGPSGT